MTKLSIVRGGGLAGMSVGTRLSSAALPAEDAHALDERIARSGVLDMPTDPAPRSSHPDELLYELTVEREGRSHTVRAPEGALPDEVRSLIEWAEARPERERRIVPPGA